MHSSRMRTARSSSRPGGGVLHQALRSRHTPPKEEAPPGADPPGSRLPLEEAPPPLLTESQTPVKIVPCPNFVAGGNKLAFQKCNQ